MEKEPEAESSSLGCILSGTWTLLSLPFWLGAAGLLTVSTTSASRFFAIALICLLPLPLNFLHWHKLSRKITTGLLFLVALGAFLLCARQAPGHNDNPEASARVTYENKSGHSRYSLANLIPEVDQSILGSYILGAIDPNLNWSRSAVVRRSIREIYDGLRGDPDLASLPSTLGSSYRDMLGFKPRAGGLFIYIPQEPGSGPGPLQKKPAIVFLHGQLGNLQACWALWKRIADTTGTAIVAPTFGAGSWSQEGGPGAIAQARKFCVNNPQIDPDKLILAGLSDGGAGVLREAGAHPGKWQRLLLLSPVIEQHTLESDTFARGWSERRALIITGERDKRATADHVRRAETSMKKIKMEVESHYLADGDQFLIYTGWPALEEIISQWLADD